MPSLDPVAYAGIGYVQCNKGCAMYCGLCPVVRPFRDTDLEKVNHPAHYGGADNPYEHIKVVEAWGLGYALGNATKYICRAGKKDSETTVEDLLKARWYVEHEIERLRVETKKT